MYDETGGTCRAHGEKKNAYRILVGKPEGKRPVGNLGVGGRIILKCILGKWDLEM
jgi:hypothetical protein